MRLPCAKGERFLPADRVTTGWSKLGRFGYALACFIFRFLRRPPNGTPIVTLAPATPGDVKPGTAVFALSQKDANGALSAGQLVVGKNGVVPPM